MLSLFTLLGIISLVCISLGVVLRPRLLEDKFYIVGGLCLLGYSIHLGDLIFIVLQVVFLGAAMWDFVKGKR